jgi:ParB family chromosome partitioning protein
MKAEVQDFAGSAAGVADDIDIRKVRPSRRPLRDELEKVDDLALSILQKGLLQPIVVRPMHDEGKFEIVAGNRRFAACKKLKMGKIPCYILDVSEKGAFEVSLVENLQRETLNVIEEAKAFARYVGEYGYGSASDLARKVGKSHSYVSRRMALLEMPAKLQEELVRARTSPSTAEELLPLDSATREVLANMIVEDKVGREEVRHIIKGLRDKKALGLIQESMTLGAYTSEEARQRSIDRAFARYITSLKVCMMRIDEILGSLDENKEWVVKEALSRYSVSMHRQIGVLMKLKRRTQQELPPQ